MVVAAAGLDVVDLVVAISIAAALGADRRAVACSGSVVAADLAAGAVLELLEASAPDAALEVGE
jgi:hypothetical protein